MKTLNLFCRSIPK